VFYVTITTDKSIPLYAQAMSRNDTLSSVRLDMFRIKPDGRGQERFYSITLLNARVASMQAVIPKSDDPKNEDTTPMFIIGFVGEKIEWHHHPTNKVESDEWIPPSQGE
jgi:type VI secretion system Hcp family effector